MDQSATLVSIVIPCWNTASYLPQTLASIASQTWKNFEVLMVDDGSKDDTWNVMQNWASRDYRFRAIRLPHNQGVVAARNAGLTLATGEFVAMLDSDDIWIPEALELRLFAAARFPEADVVATDFSWFTEDIPADPVGRVCLGPRAKEAFAECYARAEPILLKKPFELVATIHFAWTGATLVRRTAMTAVGNFAPKFQGPEDTLLWLLLADRGAFAFVPRITAHYRQRDGSLVHQQREPKEFHYLKVLNWLAVKPDFSTRKPFLRRLMAECHHINAIHFRRLAQWDRALFHAKSALKLDPISKTHWRGAAAIFLKK